MKRFVYWGAWILVVPICIASGLGGIWVTIKIARWMGWL